MVRSSGHHRKRSRSRSISPDHKRSKSSREYDKDRSRRRSRSRDRPRRSRSRDRKKDKRDSESRVRSKPLKIKRRSRSRSRSRSKSREKSDKKDDKKDLKLEDEPFDPTNLDKVPERDDEEGWVVMDVIEEPSAEDNGDLEEEYDYEADEDDQYSHHNSSSHNSHHSSPERSNQQSGETLAVKENGEGTEVLSKTEHENSDKAATGKQNTEDQLNNISEIKNDAEFNSESKIQKEKDKKDEVDKEKISDVVTKIKESSSYHKEKVKSLSSKSDYYDHEKSRTRSHSYRRSHSDSHRSEEVLRLEKDHLRQCMKLDRELHELRIKNEISRHKAEMEVIKAQLDHWKNKK